jgi:hypothetical protein
VRESKTHASQSCGSQSISIATGSLAGNVCSSASSIFDYKKRHDDFPHETTLDQMFTEEQFEVYRALGFHAAFRLFDRCDSVAHLDPVTNADVRLQIADLDLLFPRIPSGTGDLPRRKQTFTEWLPQIRRRLRKASNEPTAFS